jgi:hypothetical protein
MTERLLVHHLLIHLAQQTAWNIFSPKMPVLMVRCLTPQKAIYFARSYVLAVIFWLY